MARTRKTAPKQETPPAWRSRITGHGSEQPDQLLANPRNWRVHPERQQRALAGVLDQVGWVQDVVVNQRTGHIVDGHLRVSLAISRGEAEIPVVYVDLDETEEALVLASLDPLAGLAATDEEQLRDLLQGVTVEDDTLRALLNETAGTPDGDAEEHVEFEATKNPMVNVHLSLPRPLVRRIDAEAERLELSRARAIEHLLDQALTEGED